MRGWSTKCTDKTVVRDASEAEGVGSRLNFLVTYLPVGFTQNYVAVNACADDVIAFSRNYLNPSKAMVQVYRKAGPPSFQVANYPADRLEARTLGGRPALIAHPLVPNGRTAIYLRDDISGFLISGMQVSLDELVKVAEGIK